MSYHPLGFALLSEPVVTLPPEIAAPEPELSTSSTERWSSASEKEAAALDARNVTFRTDQLKRQAMEVEALRVSDRTLPAQPPEDWTPVPEVASEQKVPWLLLGIGAVAVLGVGYWAWRR